MGAMLADIRFDRSSILPFRNRKCHDSEMASQIARALPPGESFLKDKSRPNDGRLERALRLAGRKVRTWNLKRTPLKRESEGRKAELRKYHLSASAFFAEPGNDVCHICLKLREDGDDIRLFPSTERHHFRGRIGRLLNWKPGWIFQAAIIIECGRTKTLSEHGN